MSGFFGEAWDGLKQGAGDLVNDGAQVLGDGLDAAGLHGAAQYVDTEGDKIGYALGADVGELQLGQTGDPKELVHGDAATIRSAADKLRTFRNGFGEVANGLGRIDTGHWEGAAADAFRAKFAPEPAKWADAATATGSASAALESYSGAVESAQSEAQRAVDLWEQGQEATRQAAASYNQQVSAYNSAAQAYDASLRAGQAAGARPSQPGAFSDPGEPLREEARQVLSSARQERNTSAASAAAAIKNATGLAPKEPSFLDRLGDDASDTLGAGMLAESSLSAGALEGAAGIVKFARTLNPLDEWNLRHPAEYAAGASGALAGVAGMALNPGTAVKGLLGSGWGSDPFRAFGKLVPGVALAAVSDGGGAAADAGEAGAAADAGEAGGLAEGDPALNSAATEPQKVETGGDPVDLVTGDVLLRQTDVSLPGVLPLTLRRVHRSSQRAGRWFGEEWPSDLDQRLLVMADRIACVLSGGQVLVYRRDGLDAGGPGGVLPAAGPPWPLRREAAGTWTVTDPQNGLAWRFEPHPAYWQYAGGMGEFPLTSVRDRAGHEITFTYGESGEPVSVTHSGGYRVAVTVTGARVTGLSLGDVPLARYAYDEAGRLAEIINSAGQPLSMSYDGAGRVAGYTDRNGSGYLYTYDPSGRCVRGESPSGALSASYEYRDGQTLWTDATGAVRAYAIDGSARITAVTDPLGGVTAYARDARGRVTSETDPLGRVTRFAFDDFGNLTSVTRPDGETARAVYDERCQAVELHEAGRSVRYQEFDEAGNLTSVTRPDGSVIRYAYDQAGHLAAVTGADGAVTAVECDALGLPVAVSEPGGAVTRYERDQFGRVGRVTDPSGAVTSMTWTVEGRPLTRTFPDGSAESWAWDAEGNLLRHVSPGGAASSYEYGPFGTVTAVTGPDGTRTAFGHDGELRQTSVEHAGLTWSYAYDAAGRLTAETDYNGALTRYELDAAGQVRRRFNAAGQSVQYAYDALGNVVMQAASAAGGDDDVTTFGYDAAGDLVLARNAAAEVAIERDPLGRVTSESCNGHAVTTSYDAAGRVTGRVAPSGSRSDWAYDGSGLPTSLTAGGHTLRFAHGPSGRETSRELPGGVTLTQDWDALGRMTGQVLTSGPAAGSGPGTGPGAPAVLQQRQYAYNPDGYVTGLSDLMTGSRAFGLDPAGRVTAVTGTGWAEQYAYDPAGNITSASWPPPPEPPATGRTDTPPPGPHDVSGTLTLQAGSIRYHHDAAGRVLRRSRKRISRKPDTWHYQWNADNRLTSVTTPDGTTWRYAYDPLGRRILKQRVSADGTVLAQTRFTWDGLVLAEQAEQVPGNPDGEIVTTTWDYRPGSFTPLTQATRAALRDAPQEVIDAEFCAIITDLTGTPSELVAPDGTLAGHQQHTLWGTTYWHPDGASTPLRFPGQYADDETGLHYNNQRYYDPASGAYLTPDPLGLAPAPNPHTYVPNPHVLVDPLGLAADDNYTTGSDPQTPGARTNRPRGLRPDSNATGPHTTFRQDASGRVTHYAEWKPQTNPHNPAPWEMVKRADMQGAAHYDKQTGTYIPTPHVNLPDGSARPADPWELTPEP